MKRCLKCNCDISDRGNRAIRCNNCQKEFRKHKDDDINKKRGSTRCNKETNDWSKQIKKLSQAEIHDLVSTYRNKLRYANGREKMDIKTRIKILTGYYKDAKPLDYRGVSNRHNYYSDYDPDNIETWETSGILSASRFINWEKAKKGWTKYHDDGLVTLSPDVFFGKWKKVD